MTDFSAINRVAFKQIVEPQAFFDLLRPVLAVVKGKRASAIRFCFSAAASTIGTAAAMLIIGVSTNLAFN
jgi:hypothetical protein